MYVYTFIVKIKTHVYLTLYSIFLPVSTCTEVHFFKIHCNTLKWATYWNTLHRRHEPPVLTLS